MTLFEFMGYFASLLVFGCFYMKTMIPLRWVAIGSNAAFIVYGLMGSLYPIVVLHAILLPLNASRLVQMYRLIGSVRQASEGEVSIDRLIPFMAKRKLAKGEILFRAGDAADAMYFVLDGTLRLEEFGVEVGPGKLLGEIGVLSPARKRTGTALCQTDVEVAEIAEDKVLQIYYQSPEFGFYLVQLIIQRFAHVPVAEQA